MRLSRHGAAAPASRQQQYTTLLPQHSSCISSSRRTSSSSSSSSSRISGGRITPNRCRVASRPSTRASALPIDLLQLAEASSVDGDVFASGAAILGNLAATLFVALWTLEQQRRSAVEAELTLSRSKADDLQAQVSKLQAEVEKERKAGRDLEMYKQRYTEGNKELFKLEKALEIKDGQLEAFMVVAQRQIKYLEDMVKELRKMPAP